MKRAVLGIGIVSVAVLALIVWRGRSPAINGSKEDKRKEDKDIALSSRQDAAASAQAASSTVLPRVAADLKLGAVPSNLRLELVFDGDQRLLVLSTFRVAEIPNSLIGFSDEQASSFVVQNVEPEAHGGASGSDAELFPVFLQNRAEFVARVASAAAAGTLYRIDSAERRVARITELPKLPQGAHLLKVGTPVVAFSQDLFAALSTSHAKQPGSVHYFSRAKSLGLASLPSAGPVAALSGGKPTLVVASAHAGERVDIERFQIPEPGKPWKKLGSDPVPYTTSLNFEPWPERVCGLESERYQPLLAHENKERSVYLALLDQKTHPMRFLRTQDATLVPVCGECLPLTFERSARGLGLRVAIRRGLATDSVRTPAEFVPERDAQSAVASCAKQSVLVAYIASGKLMVQRTEPSAGWSFLPAQILAAAGAGEILGRPSVAALKERLIVMWQRTISSEKRLRLEFLVSDDGGIRFQ